MEGFYAVELQDTVAGRLIVCALYDEADKLLASTMNVTSNLATQVLIPFEGSSVATARCVFNE